ncbi:MAG: HEAT repeat domain-containing protein [Pirellulaceae bacterium]
MHSGDLSNLPNPFAPDPPSLWSRAKLVSALKMLGIAIVLFVLLLVVSSRGPGWLANRLSQNFSGLDSNAKQARLVQMSQLGVAGIQPMMVGLADEDPAVAEKTIALIRDLQTKWTTLPKAQADQNQLALINAIGNKAKTLPVTQQAWLSDLLNQSIIESVEVADTSSRNLFTAANNALSHLEQNSDTVEIQSDTAVTLSPKSMSLKLPSNATQPLQQSLTKSLPQPLPQPLPLSVATVEASWTDWPPKKPTIVQAGFLEESPNPVDRPATQSVAQTETQTIRLPDAEPIATAINVAPAPEPAAEPATVALASLSMPVVTASIDAPRKDIAGSDDSSYQVGDAVENAITQFEGLDTASIIRLLGSDHQEAVRQQAQAHLKQRGFSDRELDVAIAIANSDAGYRIELIRQLAAQQTIDPRPWLLLLLKDSDREVRTSAVSALARMLDPQVRKELRLHLIDERDQKIVVRIRHALGLVEMEG